MNRKSEKVVDGEKVYYLKDFNHNGKIDIGVSLGDYIIIDGEICLYSDSFIDTVVNHEWGHHKQSLYLGWLYLLVIGLPSALGNLWSRIFWSKLPQSESDRKYYNLPWEKWADRLGKVERHY